MARKRNGRRSSENSQRQEEDGPDRHRSRARIGSWRLSVDRKRGVPDARLNSSHVFEPLGMDSSVFFADDAILRRASVGQVHTSDGTLIVTRPWRLPRATAPAGGVVSSIRDQLTWARFHLEDGRAPDGTQLLRPETARLMRAAHAQAGTMADAVGLSWLLQKVGGVRTVKHGGTTNGQLSAFVIVPETGFAVAVCTNADRGGALHAELVRWALDRVLDVRATDPQASDIDADAAAEYTGVYEARLARS